MLILELHGLLIVLLPVSEEKNELQFAEDWLFPFHFSGQKIKLPGCYRTVFFVSASERSAKSQKFRLFLGLTKRNLWGKGIVNRIDVKSKWKRVMLGTGRVVREARVDISSPLQPSIPLLLHWVHHLWNPNFYISPEDESSPSCPHIIPRITLPGAHQWAPGWLVESQNHLNVAIARDIWTSSSQTKEHSLDEVKLEDIQVGFQYLPRRRLQNLFGQIISVLCSFTLKIKKFFAMFGWRFLCTSWCLFPHWALLKRPWAILMRPALSIFISIDMIPS